MANLNVSFSVMQPLCFSSSVDLPSVFPELTVFLREGSVLDSILYSPWHQNSAMYLRHTQYKSLEKAMAPHSSTLAWKIPWMEEPGRLQSMGSLGVGYDWATSLYFFTFMHWRRKWQPIPVFLPGESQGRGSLVGCRLWGCIESDMTEAT